MVRRPHRFSMELLEDRTVPAVATAASDATTTGSAAAAAAAQSQQSYTTLPSGEVIYNEADPSTTYVQKIYGNLLGRAPDAAAQPFIDGLQQNQISRRAVADTILHSDEFASRQINGMFQTFLGRAPDAPSLQYFVGKFHDGESIQQIGADVLASEEFRTRQGGSQEYVAALYQQVLGRAPDPDSWTQFADRVASDPGSAHSVVAEIMDSPEGRARAGEGAYATMFGGLPAGDVNNVYVQEAINGADLNTIILDIAETATYSNLGRAATTYNPGRY